MDAAANGLKARADFEEQNMMKHGMKRAVAVYLAVCGLALAQDNAPSQKDQDELAAFLNSAAAGIYKLAWPTATYKRAEFGGFERVRDGIAVTMKLSGTGLFGDSLWLRLGIVVNSNGIQDVRVIDHDALFAAPFATAKTLGELAVELGKQFSSRPQSSAKRELAGAVCIANSTEADVVFAYRWGEADWQRDTVAAGRSTVYWWRYQSGESDSPRFYIRYDFSSAAGLSEQSYWLERRTAAVPAKCEQASRYGFRWAGQKLLLEQQ